MPTVDDTLKPREAPTPRFSRGSNTRVDAAGVRLREAGGDAHLRPHRAAAARPNDVDSGRAVRVARRDRGAAADGPPAPPRPTQGARRRRSVPQVRLRPPRHAREVPGV